jgi:TP901 family phage tail tape measure protein
VAIVGSAEIQILANAAGFDASLKAGTNTALTAFNTAVTAALAQAGKQFDELGPRLAKSLDTVSKGKAFDGLTTEFKAVTKELADDGEKAAKAIVKDFDGVTKGITDELGKGDTKAVFAKVVDAADTAAKDIPGKFQGVDKRVGDEVAGPNSRNLFRKIVDGAGEAAKDIPTKFQGAAEAIEARFDAAGAKIGGLFSRGLDQVKQHSVLAGVGVAGTVGLAVKQFADYEQGINEVYTLLGKDPPRQSLDLIDSQVKSLATSFGVELPVAIEGVYQAISAGISPADTAGFTAFTETAAQFAKAGATDFATSVNLLTTGVNAFGLTAADTSRVADSLFGGIRAGKLTADDLASSLFNVAPIAHSAGIGIETVTAAIASITAQGPPATVAATGIRAALAELSKGGTQANTAFKDLAGVGFRDFIAQGGTMQGAFNILEQGAAASHKSVADMFGAIEAGQAVLDLTGSQAKRFSDNIALIQGSAGSTQVAFETMNAGVSASFARVRETVRIAAINFVAPFAPALANLATELATKLPAIIGPLSKEFSGLGVKIIPVFVEIARVALQLAPPFLRVVAALAPVISLVGALAGAFAFIIRNTPVPVLEGIAAAFVAVYAAMKIGNAVSAAQEYIGAIRFVVSGLTEWAAGEGLLGAARAGDTAATTALSGATELLALTTAGLTEEEALAAVAMDALAGNTAGLAVATTGLAGAEAAAAAAGEGLTASVAELGVASTATSGAMKALSLAASVGPWIALAAILAGLAKSSHDAGVAADVAGKSMQDAFAKAANSGDIGRIDNQVQRLRDRMAELQQLDQVSTGFGGGLRSWKAAFEDVFQRLTPGTENTILNARVELAKLNQEADAGHWEQYGRRVQDTAQWLGLTENATLSLAKSQGVLNDLVGGSTDQYEAARDSLLGASEATKGMGDAAATGAGGLAKMGDAAGDTKEEMKKLKEEVDALKSSLGFLFNFKADQLFRDVAKAGDDLTKALHGTAKGAVGLGGAVDINKKGGAELQAQFESMNRVLQDTIVAQKENSISAADSARIQQALGQEFANATAKAHLSKDEIAGLSDKYLGLSRLAGAGITLNVNTQGALIAVDNLQRALAAVTGKTVSITAQSTKNAFTAALAASTQLGRADGGLVDFPVVAGEAGAELILPLTRPNRMRALLAQYAGAITTATGGTDELTKALFPPGGPPGLGSIPTAGHRAPTGNPFNQPYQHRQGPSGPTKVINQTNHITVDPGRDLWQDLALLNQLGG